MMSSSDVPWNPFCQNTSRAASSASSGSKLRGLAIGPIYALSGKSQSAVSSPAIDSAGLRDRRLRLPAEQDALVEPADRDQHQAQANERQRAVDSRQGRHVDQERLDDRQRDDGGGRQPRTLRINQDADAEQDHAEHQPGDRVSVLFGAGGGSPAQDRAVIQPAD